MNINYFSEFLILAGTLNFRTASQKMFISQSTLSRHMESLENELGTRLFNRTTQNVSLTETGRLLLKRAEGLIDEYNDIKEQIELIESNLKGHLRIGVPYYSVADYLGSIPTEFEMKYPDIRTEYIVDTPTDVHTNLVNNKTDIGFLVDYKLSRSSSLEYVPVYKERIGVVLNT
ncbi:LysR family transcriptional regulator, partial [uncultured Methanobrevibacter sp.]|uniref:LysR family transcriptional regulator n=1 Tax=uncultured Methanobrevibacter sp. TaxID=253161 RepID=UPI003208FCE4